MPSKAAHQLLSLPREEACKRFSAWWGNYVNTKHGNSVQRACKHIFGLDDNGKPGYYSQASKWQFYERNTLPSQVPFDQILKKCKVTADEILSNDYPNKTIAEHGTRNRFTGPKKGKQAMPKTEAVFTVDDPEVPTPDMSFQTSEEFDGMYDFELSATLPMSGVLAVMALMEDAFGK